MGQLMLINPARRTRKTKRKATPAQLRALAKGRRTRALASNPAPRKRRAAVMRAASVPVGRRKARRNPIGFDGITSQLVSAATAAGGALAVDTVVGFLPLPAGWNIGVKKDVVKLGLAVGLGIVGKRFIGRAAGKMAEGAMVVSAYNIIKSFMPAPASAVAGLAYMSPGINAGCGNALPNMSVQSPNMGEYVSGLGEYVYQ